MSQKHNEGKTHECGHNGKCSCGQNHDGAQSCHKHGEGCSCNHDHQTSKSEGSCSSCSCSHSHGDDGCSSHDEHPESDDPDHQPKSKHSYDEVSSCGCGHNHNNSHNHQIDDGCGCGHEHSHEKNVTKLGIILLSASFVIFVSALFIPNEILKAILFGASTLLAGYDLFLNGLKMLFKFKFEENVLLLIAVVASFALLEYPEACLVTILFKLGSFLESAAINRSKKSMEKLTQIRPDFAYIKNQNGNIVSIDAKLVKIGDEVYLRSGDRVAVDSEIIEGNSSIDSSALTGESVPVYVKPGDELMSGSVNLSGLLKCRATKTFENSTASQIIDLVYSSSKAKGKTENFISRLARVYTPIVIILAVIIAVVPPLLGIGTFDDFIMRSLIFLVASCPCALVISIPLTFFASIGAVSKHGVLVKGSMYIEQLSKITAVALDKTGTLTSGELEFDRLISVNGMDEMNLLSVVAGVESNSTHPIAASIVKYANSIDIKYPTLENVTEHAGLGLTADMHGVNIICGGKNMLEKYDISITDLPPANVYICLDKKVEGYVLVKEQISPDSLTLKKELADVGVNRVIMLTGDNEASARSVAEKCGITEFYAGLLPQDKVKMVKVVQESQNKVLFVGDGINDAPVLTCADLGMSMGLGSEIANSSSDIVLSSNRLKSLPNAIRLSKRSMRVVYFNIIFALAIKVIVLVLGATSYGSMWLAVFADIGVTILTVLNAIRLLRAK